MNAITRHYTSLALALIVGWGATEAQAVTIEGINYERVISGDSVGRDYLYRPRLRIGAGLGFWPSMQKYMTVNGQNGPGSAPLQNVEVEAPDLRSSDFRQLYVLGLTNSSANRTTLRSGDLSFTNAIGETVLSARYLDNGNLNAVIRADAAGSLNINGRFIINGGTLFTRGILTGTIFAQFAWINGTHVHPTDFVARDGSFTIFREAGGERPPIEVPEPFSLGLLGVGLVGLQSGRKKYPQTS